MHAARMQDPDEHELISYDVCAPHDLIQPPSPLLYPPLSFFT